MALIALLLLTGAKEKGPSVKTLVDQLAACEALNSCPAVQELKKRGPAIWPDLEVGLKHPDEMTRYWTLGVLTVVVIPKAQKAIADSPAEAKVTWAAIRTAMAPLLTKITELKFVDPKLPEAQMAAQFQQLYDDIDLAFDNLND